MARAPVSGRPIWIETKSKDGKLTPEQIAFREEVVSRFGDVYLEARTLEEIREVFEPGYSIRRSLL